jgi:hypothetical protein
MAATTVYLEAKGHLHMAKLARELSGEVKRILGEHCRRPGVQHLEVHQQGGKIGVLVKFYYEGELVRIEEIPF